MKKLFYKLLALMITLMIMFNLVTIIHGASIVDINDDSVFLKQQSSNTCTLASALMMFRRGALINGNPKWNTFTETSYKSKWWSQGLNYAIAGEGMSTKTSYGMQSKYKLFPGDANGKKALFVELLNKHPEGIVIYTHASVAHAVLLTDYDKTTDAFYCADPSNLVPSGRIPITKTDLKKYILEEGYSQGNLNDQDFIIAYIDQIWMIETGIDYSSYESPSAPTTTKTQYRYHHYTNGSKYSVCAYYANSTYGGKFYREDTGWLDEPLKLVSKANGYTHPNQGTACTNAGCIDPSWTGGKYEDSNGIPWFREETRTISVSAECSHTYNSGEITKDATCTKSGTMTYTCTVCKNKKTESLPSLGGHSYNPSISDITKEATCTSDGVKAYPCQICGDIKTETIPKINHDYDDGVVTKEATYKSNGIVTFTCTKCGITKSQSIPKLIAPEPEQTAVTECTHSYKSEKTTKTQYRYYHYTNGSKYSVCAYYANSTYGGKFYREDTGWLDEPLERVSSAKGYTHPNQGAACTNAGCIDPSWTGGKYVDSNGIPWFREETRTVNISTECSHTYNSGKITKDATCTSTGTKVRTCTKCGGTENETIAKLGHSYDSGVVTKASTCGESGIKTYTCSTCGNTKKESIAKFNSHSYNSGVITKEPSCTQTGTKTYTCAVCSTTKTETIKNIGHSYNAGVVTKEATYKENGVKAYTCMICGAIKNETIPQKTVSETNSSQNDSAVLTDNINKWLNGEWIDKQLPTFPLWARETLKEALLYAGDKLYDEKFSDYYNITEKILEGDNIGALKEATNAFCDIYDDDSFSNFIILDTDIKKEFVINSIFGMAESYINYGKEPNFENFSNVIWSGTLGSAFETVCDNAWDVVKHIPGVSNWYENHGATDASDAFKIMYAESVRTFFGDDAADYCGTYYEKNGGLFKGIVNGYKEIKKAAEESDGGLFGSWLNGIKLMFK